MRRMKMATRITKRNAAIPPASQNVIDQSRMTYGEKGPLKELNNEVKNLNLGQETPTAAPTPEQNLSGALQSSVFAPTDQPLRPVEDGLDFGPGVGSQGPTESTEELIQKFFDLTGDPLLANLLKG